MSDVAITLSELIIQSYTSVETPYCIDSLLPSGLTGLTGLSGCDLKVPASG